MKSHPLIYVQELFKTIRLFQQIIFLLIWFLSSCKLLYPKIIILKNFVKEIFVVSSSWDLFIFIFFPTNNIMKNVFSIRSYQKNAKKNTMSIYNIIFQAVRRDQPYFQLKCFSKFCIQWLFYNYEGMNIHLNNICKKLFK